MLFVSSKPRKGRVTNEWRQAVEQWLATRQPEKMTKNALAAAIKRPSGTVSLVLDPAPQGRQPVEHSSVAQEIAAYTRIPLPEADESADALFWDSMKEAVRNLPPAQKEVVMRMVKAAVEASLPRNRKS